MPDRIQACIVNHNTSEFVELAVRTLAATNVTLLRSDRLSVTVIDNHSEDEGLPRLVDTCRELGIGFELSAWPASQSPVNSHGDVLRAFVAEHEPATHFLFIDADVWFPNDDTVERMLAELAALPDVWAVQARFSWLEEHQGPGASFKLWAGRSQQLRVDIDDATAGPFTGGHKPRCHPALSLIENSPVFRRVADTIGLSAAVIIAADPETAGFSDTLGLATMVMTTHQLRHVLSAETVEHYHGVSYDDPGQPLGEKLTDCRRRLAALR